MTVEGKAPLPTREMATGDRRWSVVEANAADGDTVEMDGDVIFALADSDTQDVTASVTGTTGADATLQVLNVSDGASATASDVTVVALVE